MRRTSTPLQSGASAGGHSPRIIVACWRNQRASRSRTRRKAMRQAELQKHCSGVVNNRIFLNPGHTDAPRATLRGDSTHDFPRARAVFHNNSTSQSQRLTSPSVPRQPVRSLHQDFPLPVRQSGKSKLPALPAAYRPVDGVRWFAIDAAHSDRAVLLCHSLPDDRPAGCATSAIGCFFPRTLRSSTSAGGAAQRTCCFQRTPTPRWCCFHRNLPILNA